MSEKAIHVTPVEKYEAAPSLRRATAVLTFSVVDDQFNTADSLSPRFHYALPATDEHHPVRRLFISEDWKKISESRGPNLNLCVSNCTSGSNPLGYKNEEVAEERLSSYAELCIVPNDTRPGASLGLVLPIRPGRFVFFEVPEGFSTFVRSVGIKMSRLEILESR